MPGPVQRIPAGRFINYKIVVKQELLIRLLRRDL